ncbi:MAG: metallophosphoesterase family protein [Bacteroidales bacterium]|nr:metallophosphatase family protein [Bacteroidales bacterium]MDD4604333.1 metallophosphoesterase family protein [Bacteroidales bacterium]
MLKIGILSDTHTYLPPRVLDFFSDVDEIWHAGDIGDLQTAKKLAACKPLRAVFGNIDGQEIRKEYPQDLLFFCEGVKVLMTHIGGYPGRYNPRIRALIELKRPQLVVCGHSHILKVIYDKKWSHLHINPGAAGKYGIHHSITAIRLIIEGKNMRDLEVLDLPKTT